MRKPYIQTLMIGNTLLHLPLVKAGEDGERKCTAFTFGHMVDLNLPLFKWRPSVSTVEPWRLATYRLEQPVHFSDGRTIIGISLN